MISGSRGVGTRKHRKLRYHKRVPVSLAAKEAVRVASIPMKRLILTEWYASLRELFEREAAR